MEYKTKPHVLRRITAYLCAALTFTIMGQVILQPIIYIRSGDFIPLSDGYISCLVFTFSFLCVAGFLRVALGHLLKTLSHIKFNSLIYRHSFAYVIGYIVVVLLSVWCVISTSPEMGVQILSGIWAYIAAAFILFLSALMAGYVFARVYEKKLVV